MKRSVVLQICTIILCMCLMLPAAAHADEHVAPTGMSLEKLEELIDDYANEYIGETAAGASIIVVKDQEMILSKEYGYADMESRGVSRGCKMIIKEL